jgi:L-lactate dehydrogenase complex protein LldG
LSLCSTPGDIVGNLHHAYRDPLFKAARYAVLITGPSATADIEGVLIHGAQGVCSLTVLLLPRPIDTAGRSRA